jgi:large subunit ribosomal protein L21
MYAVIKSGGKQYRVAPDQVLTVEKLDGEAGDIVAFEEVLMVGNGAAAQLGAPLVAGATVAAEVLEQGRGPKIIVFKKKRRKNQRSRNGHRQEHTVLRITEILTDGKKPSKAAAKKPAPAKQKAEAKPTAAPEKAAEPKPEAKAKPTAAPKTETKAKAAPKKAPAKKAPAKKAAPKKAAAKKAPAKKAPAKKAAAKKKPAKKT